jgi:hypothetical protein
MKMEYGEEAAGTEHPGWKDGDGVEDSQQMIA